jgi:hypothetical protein
LSNASHNDSRDLVAQQNDKISALTALVEKLQAKVTRLEGAHEVQPAFAGIESNAPVDRRSMLKGAGLAAAAAGAAAIVVSKASPAGAIVNPGLILDQSNNAEFNTTVQYDGTAGAAKVVLLVNDTTFNQSQSGFRSAIAGWAGGNSATTTDTGVYGYSEASGGVGVAGAGFVGVVGQSNGEAGVLAEGDSSARGLIARSTGSQGVWSQLTSGSNSHDSIRAETAGAGSGIYATSVNGAGGKFGGKTANIHLVPSTASSHPASGSAGQLFVDKSNRLWYCRGGSNWAQLA